MGEEHRIRRRVERDSNPQEVCLPRQLRLSER